VVFVLRVKMVILIFILCLILEVLRVLLLGLVVNLLFLVVILLFPHKHQDLRVFATPS